MNNTAKCAFQSGIARMVGILAQRPEGLEVPNTAEIVRDREAGKCHDQTHITVGVR
jgi:hypothetical protein